MYVQTCLESSNTPQTPLGVHDAPQISGLIRGDTRGMAHLKDLMAPQNMFWEDTRPGRAPPWNCDEL